MATVYNTVHGRHAAVVKHRIRISIDNKYTARLRSLTSEEERDLLHCLQRGKERIKSQLQDTLQRL